MRAFLLAAIVAVSTSFSMAQTPAKVDGLNAASAEAVIAASLQSVHIGNYSKVDGAEEWVSDYTEFSSHVVEKYRARYDFRLEGNDLWVSMRDLEEWGADGWNGPMIPAKGAEQKLIAQMADRLNSARKALPASASAAAPLPATSGGLRVAMIPGSDETPQTSAGAPIQAAPVPPQAVSDAAYPPAIAGITLRMPYATAHKIAEGLYGSNQEKTQRFTSGTKLKGEAWSLDNLNATAVASTDNGLVDFVGREKVYLDPAARSTWVNFRKALIAQYGPPSAEEQKGFGDPYYQLSWFYDSQWHILSGARLPQECLYIDVTIPLTFPFGAVRWLPPVLHKDCPARLIIEVRAHDTLVDFYDSFMYDEPAAVRDWMEEANQKKLEEENKLREAEKVKPTF